MGKVKSRDEFNSCQIFLCIFPQLEMYDVLLMMGHSKAHPLKCGL